MSDTFNPSLYKVLWFLTSILSGVSRFVMGLLLLYFCCSSWIFRSLSCSFSYAILCLKAILLFTSTINFLCIINLLHMDYIFLTDYFSCSSTWNTNFLKRYLKIIFVLNLMIFAFADFSFMNFFFARHPLAADCIIIAWWMTALLRSCSRPERTSSFMNILVKPT